jgi:glycerol-3-phosphate dehydrogenase
VRPSAETTYDVAIIGTGVVGTAIARELSRYELSCLLLEAAADVGSATSKANTAILHTGFDSKPGTLEAQLVRRGHQLLMQHGPDLGIAIERLGALLVAWTPEQLTALDDIAANAARNGYSSTHAVRATELYSREPHLGIGALGALEIPDESIICPFTPPLAFATQAVVNGVVLALSTPLLAVTQAENVHGLTTPQQGFRARYVVNAAGLHSDTVDRLFGHQRFKVIPRRGELIVFDKLARPLLNHILLPVPTKTTKGVLISPTVFGNVLLGPTADDIDDKTATASTPDGLTRLRQQARHLLPAVLDEEISAVYVGLRAATEHGDYQIHFHPEQRYVCVGGIRSTGLSASMAIAEHVVAGLADAGLRLQLRDHFESVRLPNLGEAFCRSYQDADLIGSNADYGRIVCHCERVTRGEILAAASAAIPARSLDGVRRRTRALLGRCQGFYCLAEVAALLGRATDQPLARLLGLDGEVGS